MKELNFIILKESFTIHRLSPGDNIPKNLFTSPFYNICQTAEELSIVALDSIEIKSEESNPGWSVLKIAGPLDFSLTGILAGISSILAEAGISIFAISTFDTDYILLKTENLRKAKLALKSAGHKFPRVNPEYSMSKIAK